MFNIICVLIIVWLIWKIVLQVLQVYDWYLKNKNDKLNYPRCQSCARLIKPGMRLIRTGGKVYCEMCG